MDLKIDVNVVDCLPESVGLGAAAMLSQREKGVEKYGQSIEDAKLSAGELAQHAMEEMADGLVYTVMLAKRVKELEDQLIAANNALLNAKLNYNSTFGKLSSPWAAGSRIKDLEALVAELRANGRADLTSWTSTDGSAYFGPGQFALNKSGLAYKYRESLAHIRAKLVCNSGSHDELIAHIDEVLK